MATFKYTGVLEIEPLLELNNPRFETAWIYYNLRNNKYTLVVDFFEGDAIQPLNARHYEITNATPGKLEMTEVLAFINSHPILGQFTMEVPT